MNKITLALAMSLLALGACTDTDGGETGATGDTTEPYAGPWQIEVLTFTCASDVWDYDVTTSGWAGDMTLDIFQTGNWLPGQDTSSVWDEFHTMNNVEFAEDGSWDHWDRQLDVVTTTGAVVSGSTTLFDCAEGDDSLAWKVDMLDDNGAVMDCAIRGLRATEYWTTEVGATNADGDACFLFTN